MFEFYTDKFKNFTCSSDKTVNEVIVEFVSSEQSIFTLDDYLLSDVVRLLEKSILNKLSSDLQFKNNYWSWGFVTVYYSNFYLAQILNRLSNKFYIFANKNINKEISYDTTSGAYYFGQNNGDNTHQREFKLLKSNYSKLKTFTDSQLLPILITTKLQTKDEVWKYTFDNIIKESEIRNIINYQLKHYREIELKNKTIDSYKKFYENILTNTRYSSHYPDYFQLLMINEKRFLFLSMLIQEIKTNNPGFEIKINKLKENIENKYTTIFHDVNPETKKLIGDLLK